MQSEVEIWGFCKQAYCVLLFNFLESGPYLTKKSAVYPFWTFKSVISQIDIACVAAESATKGNTQSKSLFVTIDKHVQGHMTFFWNVERDLEYLWHLKYRLMEVLRILWQNYSITGLFFICLIQASCTKRKFFWSLHVSILFSCEMN